MLCGDWIASVKFSLPERLPMDNGPESSGRRTQFLSRMVQFADVINKPIQLLSYPPSHSQYNPSERWWGILEVSVQVV